IAGDEAFTDHAQLFHRPVRPSVDGIAHRLNATQAELLESVIDEQSTGLDIEPMAPVMPRQGVADLTKPPQAAEDADVDDADDSGLRQIFHGKRDRAPVI